MGEVLEVGSCGNPSPQSTFHQVEAIFVSKNVPDNVRKKASSTNHHCGKRQSTQAEPVTYGFTNSSNTDGITKFFYDVAESVFTIDGLRVEVYSFS